MSDEQVQRHAITDASIQAYQTFLQEQYRPPSRGGNTSALHSHVLTIDGKRYSFLARGARKWVYQGDTVSFEYTIKDGKYKNIDKATIQTLDKNRKPVIRGDRRWKPTLRVAPSRMPASRREQRN